MLHKETKPFLQEHKNLLAFSAGVDSTALFFLLLEENICFDIAIVDYGIRAQSKEEVAYAQTLAKQYNIHCHIYTAPPIEKNFEAQARTIRYNFFDTLHKKYNYTSLITAHHLGDRFEWMLMQFCKGAGCVELSGMQPVQQHNNFLLLRPLLEVDKSELLAYLHHNNIYYFEDSSNSDFRYTRNRFRHQHAMPLLQQYKEGIKKSFTYIDNDKKALIQPPKIYHLKALYYFHVTHPRNDIYAIDQHFKSLGILLSHHEKLQLQEKKTHIVARKYVVTQHQNFILIAPYVRPEKGFSKSFKEQMRKLRIEPKLRGYLVEEPEVVTFLSLLFA